MKSALLAILALPAIVRAAEPAQLEGTVRDATDAVLPDTDISCLQEETGFRFHILTNDAGEYRLIVPGGHYKVIARHDGFRALAQLGVAVPAGGARRLDFRLDPGSVLETITVSADADQRQFAESDGAFVIQPDILQTMPQNDRTVSGLIQLAPGMLITPANGGESGQFSSLGARQNSNRYTVDGVSANNAVAGGGWPSFLPGARLPAMTALGTTHDLAMFDAIQEVRVVTQGFAPEAGRAPGGNIAIHTKTGANQFHGSLFYANRPAWLEANDWFANASPMTHGNPAFYDAGGSLGGPIRRNRTFFFLSAEGLGLRQVYSWTATVPSRAARALAPASLLSLIDQFPLPNGPNLSFGIGELLGSTTRPAGLGAGGLRIDHEFNSTTRAFLRAALTPSWSESGFTEINSSNYENAVATLGLTYGSTSWLQDTRASFSRTLAASRWLPQTGTRAGGDFYSQFPSFAADFSSISVGGAGSIDMGEAGRNRQDQIQLSHRASFHRSNQNVSIGFEYIQLRPVRSGPVSNFNVAFSSPTNLLLGPAAPLWVTYSTIQTSASRLNQFSGFVQDTWQIHPRLSATFGLRFLSAPPPGVAAGANLFAVNESSSGVTYSPMAAGTPLWHWSPVGVDPSLSLAWRLTGRGDTVLRLAWTSFHDVDFAVGTDQLNGSPYLSMQSPPNLAVFNGVDLIPVQLGYGFATDLHLPVYRRWDVSLQRKFSSSDSIALSYSGMTGNHLLRRDTVFYPQQAFGQLSFATNNGASNYNGFNAIYRHTLTRGLQGTIAYSWSHSIDLGSSDFELFVFQPGSASRNRGPSDFDVRHTANATLSYSMPGHWTLSGLFYARTGFPIDVVASETFQGSAVSNNQPDLISGVPVWIPDSSAPGGQRLNAAAFRMPASATGNLGRNAIRGFGEWQADVAAQKPIRLGESIRIAIRGEAFNVFNHAQFADPTRYLSNLLFGLAASPLNLMLGSGSPISGQSPAFQMGGPRALQVSVRLSF